jgi:adenosylmethionine-8-amino-7-oxononanoate aminotransferase
MVAVVVALRILLRLKKALSNVGEEHVMVLQQGVHGVYACNTYSVGEQGRRRAAIYYLKR